MEYISDDAIEDHVQIETIERVPTIGNEVEIDNPPDWQRITDEDIVNLITPQWPENNIQLQLNPVIEIARIEDVQGPAFQIARIPNEPGVEIPEPPSFLDPLYGDRGRIVFEPPENIDDNARPPDILEIIRNIDSEEEDTNEEVEPVNENAVAEPVAAPADVEANVGAAPAVIIIDDESSGAGEIQEEPDPEEIEMAKKKFKLDVKPNEKTKSDDEDDDLDVGRLCPICMDYWSNSGEHRLCSLRCGHLFGHSCVLKWLQVACSSGNRRCPQCNKKATVKDIRIIYATNVQVIDTVEIDVLKKQLLEMTSEKNRIEMELTKCQLRQRMYEDQISGLVKTIKDLEKQKSDMSNRINDTMSNMVIKKFRLERSLDICKDGGCRVLDYNPWYGCLAVSQKSGNALFSGYGVKKIIADKFQTMQFVLLHNQAIRDIAFHPLQQALLLSVSFDKTAKLMDIQNNLVVHGYPVDGQVWSCCWSGDNPNIFHAGTQNGSIMQFDIRQTAGAVDTLESPGDRSPVVSLASVPPNSAGGIIRGGFLATHLNTCYAYEQWNSVYVPKQMFLDGPFVSIRYDEKNNHALISSRPNARQPHARHVVLSIEKGNEEAILCNIVHTFHAGNSQKLLSRPCHINVDNDTLIAAHQESTSTIPLWSISNGRQIHNIPVSDPVLDMVSFNVNNNCFLATLSAKKLRLYNYGQVS
ncbi:hypothetical protein PV328_002006 [Microctonus aethiopoides]|uniref:RING-type E3 ubiquitin transferase n=1 Tax=Microctonus aethiopoides TaxID=144406 RepID=A0AA39FYT9_9HYME|nr:hypothetical protein PV328_002006 [Microctonus aethiopoides]